MICLGRRVGESSSLEDRGSEIPVLNDGVSTCPFSDRKMEIKASYARLVSLLTPMVPAGMTRSTTSRKISDTSEKWPYL